MHQRKQHNRIWLALVTLVLSSLACTFAGASAPAPDTTPTVVVEIPTREPPTAPPLAPSLVPTKAPPTPIPPTDTPTGTGPGGCILSEQFVVDVTIPDGTVLAPGTPFGKTWRVKNNGTCDWENYQLIFAAGDQMSGPAAVNVNRTPAGSTTDVLVNLVAPSAHGEYKGGWRFKATNGSVFGGLTVVISVPAPATATPLPAATAVPVNWNGQWITNCGTANCGVMNLSQNGNKVTGTYADNGTLSGTLNGNRLSGTWTRGATSGSFDWWLGGSGAKWRGNYNSINGWCGYRSGQTEPSPCGVATFTGDWNTVGEQFNAPLSLYQDGSQLVGTLVLPSGNVAMNGSIDGTKASGTWNQPGGTSNTFTWYLLNPLQFNGNYDGDKKWCGYRSGSSAPVDCYKP